MSARTCRSGRVALSLACAVGLTFAARRAAAEDGAYGRIEGDVDVRAGAGVAFGSGGPSFAATAAAIYLQTAGFYAEYTDSFGSDDAAVRRSIAAGVHLQPLFLARYASNLEHGPAHLDLLLDSLAFEVGACWAAPRGGSLDGEPGLEIALAAGVPILPDATGPYIDLRAALRWRPLDLRGPSNTDAFDRGAMLTMTLAFHKVVGTHLVDGGDALVR